MRKLRELMLVLTIGIASISYADTPLFGLDSEALLDTLDMEMTRSAAYHSAKEDRIATLRRKLADARDPEHRYWLSRDLYNEYSSYDSDSAMSYINRSLEIAESLGQTNWQNEMILNKSYIFAATGVIDSAQYCIDRIDVSMLSNTMAVEYFEKKLFLATHREQYFDRNSLESDFVDKNRGIINEIFERIPATDPLYCWLIGWLSFNNPEKSAEVLPVVKSIVEKSRLNTRKDAMDAWVLSQLYRETGDEENCFRFLVMSAIADVRASNKEIASLESIAGMLNSRGELDRANEYMKFCLECANDYHSRVRVGRLADLQYRIGMALSQKTQDQAARLRFNFIALICILVILLLAIGYIYIQYKRLSMQKGELDRTNGELNRRIGQLQEARTQLADVNGQLELMVEKSRRSASDLAAANVNKERYIADIFSMCSDYISKLDDFRRDIYRKIMAHKFEEVKDLTKSPELSHSEIKELYANFDRIFLKVYPDFVEDFNTLLRPDERITLRKGELLNTELRIYAFVRLGINDSVKIAKFLHCSVQTVYNTRQRVRNKSDIPKESFAARVRQLGTPSI